MKRVALLLVLLLAPIALQAFDGDRPETVRIAVLRSNDTIPVQLRNELRRAGFDAFTIDLTFEEIEQLEERDADFYVEVLTADRIRENVWGEIGVYGRNVDMNIGVVSVRVDARVQVYDAQTLELLARFDIDKGKTTVAPTGFGIGGRNAGLWVGVPLGWMQNRSAKRAIAKDAAIKVAEVVREP